MGGCGYIVDVTLWHINSLSAAGRGCEWHLDCVCLRCWINHTDNYQQRTNPKGNNEIEELRKSKSHKLVRNMVRFMEIIVILESCYIFLNIFAYRSVKTCLLMLV